MDRNQNQELASNQVPVLFLNTKKKKKKKQWNKNQAKSYNIQNQICKPLQYSSTVTGKDCFLICYPVSF